MAYQIKSGETLSGIATANKTTVDALLKANPTIKDPNVIQAGASLNLPSTDFVQPVGAPSTTPGFTAPTVTDIGIGKLTTIPKAPLSTPAPTEKTTTPDLSGAYARTGITPPPPVPATSTQPPAAATPTVPQYPTAGAGTPQTKITDAYDALLKSISAIEEKLTTAATKTPEEERLQKDLVAKKAALGAFDVGSLQATEDLYGQGRGITTSTLARQDQKIQRTRSLERLGLATEADTLTNQLAIAQENRKNLGDLAQTEFSLATKKLDIALGIQKEIQSLDQKEQDNARQYLLDLVGHFDGKTFDQLDPATKQSITEAVANSPITLDMVKTALKTSVEKAKAAADGRLYSVSGLGVVMVNADGSGYKVVVPETPAPAPAANVPTFEDYVSTQNLPIPSLTPERLNALRGEYDTKYGGATVNVNLGKLSPTDKNNISQAGLSGAASAVQAYFLNTPAGFQQTFARDYVTGSRKGTPSLDDISSAYQTWYDAQQSTSNDWAGLLKAVQATK